MSNIITHVAAGADLSGANGQYRVLAIGGTLVGATPNALARGILQNKPKSGEDASLLVAGKSIFQAGAAITAGARLKVASGGFCLVANSGDAVVGWSEFAVASGAFSPQDCGHFDFATLGYNNGT
jgi:hypothetical protein